MTESEVEKTTVWVPISLHLKLKLRSVNNRSSIEEEIEKILKKEFGIQEE